VKEGAGRVGEKEPCVFWGKSGAETRSGVGVEGTKHKEKKQSHRQKRDEQDVDGTQLREREQRDWASVWRKGGRTATYR